MIKRKYPPSTMHIKTKSRMPWRTTDSSTSLNKNQKPGNRKKANTRSPNKMTNQTPKLLFTKNRTPLINQKHKRKMKNQLYICSCGNSFNSNIDYYSHLKYLRKTGKHDVFQFC
jgi:hypothetical protein